MVRVRLWDQGDRSAIFGGKNHQLPELLQRVGNVYAAAVYGA